MGNRFILLLAVFIVWIQLKHPVFRVPSKCANLFHVFIHFPSHFCSHFCVGLSHFFFSLFSLISCTFAPTKHKAQ
ncbi:membrane protein [gut metagenome]|uniref:Membrane protein n=1 Tax=gut metagenome TaxID=749906 RepID=J9FQD5_9ZZZZ